ncbi:MAG: alpha/beta fold hydrolase [Promethearchaeota archaeon]
MPMIKVNDINMYYEIHGKGFPFVMIMGLSANSDWWATEIIENFAKYYKVIIFDNRDAGQTDISDQPYTIKLFADDTAALMDALNIEKAHVMGCSMGGMIAQELYLNYPEKVEKLVLGCTNCGGSKQILASQDVLEVLGSAPEDQTREEFIDDTIPLLFTEKFINDEPEFIENYKKLLLKHPMEPDAFKRQVGAIMGFNSFRRLKNINVPTLVVHGKEDRLIPAENAGILAEKIPNAKVVLFDDAAHSFFEPEPELVFNTIVEFLQAPVEKQVETVV